MPANRKYPAWSDEERNRLTALWRDHEVSDIAETSDQLNVLARALPGTVRATLNAKTDATFVDATNPMHQHADKLLLEMP